MLPHARATRLPLVNGPFPRACLALALALPWHLAGMHAASHPAARQLRRAVNPAYGHLPLAFEPNVGQADPRVRFLARGPGYTLFLTESGAVLSLRAAQPRHGSSPLAIPPRVAPDGSPAARPPDGRTAAAQHTIAVVHLTLAGANRHPRLVGSERLPGVVSYFIGDDPRRWHTGIPTYARVVVRDVYPGIDEVFSGDGGRLSYGFALRPGARPSAIALAVRGGALAVDAQGGLALRTPLGAVMQRAPLLYLLGAGGLIRAAGRYRRAGSDLVGVVVDRSMAAAPAARQALSYVTYLGGSGDDTPGGIAVDGAGDAYVGGTTYSADFPATPGTVQGAYSAVDKAGGDAFVAKLNPTGTAVLYATYLGGRANDVRKSQSDHTAKDSGTAIAVDEAGEAYLAGITYSSDFPTTDGAPQRKYGGGDAYGGDGFAVKLNATGTALLYATYLGGSGEDNAYGLALDGLGNAYVTGDTGSPDFPTTPHALDVNPGGPTSNVFVVKLNAAGTKLLYSALFGGGENDWGYAIAVDASGSAYVTGVTASPDFPVTPGSLQWQPSGSIQVAFVAKLNPAGTTLSYATYLAGSFYSGGNGIAVDGAGDAYVTGWTQASDFPVTHGALQTHFSNKSTAGFVAKLNPTGKALIYSTFLGGSGDDDSGSAIAVDGAGDAYVTGQTQSRDFPVTRGAWQDAFRPTDKSYLHGQAYVAMLNAGGNALLYASYLGGIGDDGGTGIAVAGGGQVYVAGWATSSAFPITPGALRDRFGGGDDYGGDAFVARLEVPIVGPPPALDPVSPPPAGTPGVRYFPATHHSLAGPFLAFWQQHGGTPLLGLPLSQPFRADGQTVQYTERARLVLAGSTVSISPLGRLLSAGRSFPAVPPVPDSATLLYFPSTGHTLGGRFLIFWQAHQGSALLGPPISEPLRESNGDGSGRRYLVQYFANARLEYHPEATDPRFQVQVGRLGYEYLHRRGLL